jgi:hypothetical protein
MNSGCQTSVNAMKFKKILSADPLQQEPHIIVCGVVGAYQKSRNVRVLLGRLEGWWSINSAI